MEWRTLWWCILALSVTGVIALKAKKGRSSNHVNSICSTWGRQHFKTFDGQLYQFPGMCEYTLASNCHGSYQEFSVLMKRSEAGGNPTVSYVVVTISDLDFHLTKNLIRVNGEVIDLPYYKAGVQLERNAIYTKLHSKVGITVMWNGDDAVMVELDPQYANRTCGLCGDFNGDSVYNEFIHNGRMISLVEFGNLQKVHRPNDDCEDPYENDDEPTDNTLLEDKCKDFRVTCNQLLHSESWKSCGTLLDPEPYLQACVQDMCGCANTTDDFCICSTLAEFSRQCSHAGGSPPNWRTPQFCAKQCPYNMVYLEDGSPCMDTCTHSDTSSLCEEHKMDGCFCPPGTVFDNISKRGCITQDQCQCKHDKVYNSGEVYKQDKEECVCHHGKWSCKSLPSPATCAIEEGSHVTTFDGKGFIFHGDCYYTLAKVENKESVVPKFTILVQLAPCVSNELDTCLKTVVVLLNNDRNNALVFTANGKVKHNAEINLPYSTADINIFQPSSFHIILQTSFGLQLQIQLVPIMQVYVTLDQMHKMKTRGLCGNYNMVLGDDMKSPQGIVEGTASSFGSSWKSNPSCPDRVERLDDPCALSVENEKYAEHWCSLLKNPESTFAKCHTSVDPEMYFKRCTYSSCNCEKSEDCLCAVFSSYARACATKGVVLTGWRENVCDKYTRSCPISQTFSYQLQRCQLTCRSLSSERQGCTLDFQPVDGCSCPQGLYLDDKGVCVPVDKCPCYNDGVHVKPGKSINIRDEHCICTNGKLHCRSWKVHLHSETCPSTKVFFNCSTAGSGEIGVQCAKNCRNLDSDDCYTSECQSGCQCPSGLVDDNRGNCVKEHDCPCLHDGLYYASGQRIPVQCNTCTCKRGHWECTDKKCSGTCTIFGSGHYSTFDQRTYGFSGECGYVALQNKCGEGTVQDFGVITENIPCGSTGTTCSKSVRIKLGRTELKLSHGSYEVTETDEGVQIKYNVRNVGLYLVVESAIGLSILWDRKTTVRIILEPHHMGEVCGLCGDYNGDAQNDFTTQSQITVSSVLEFANSWQTSYYCPDAEANTESCVDRPNRHNWAKMQCSIIKGITFQDCHKKVDPTQFYENCVKDSCACDSGGDCECLCTAVAAYAQACNEAGVCVNWRTPEICPVFCDYYNEPNECKWHYSPCHTPCYKTCLNPQGICSNPIPNLEGCYPVCPEDKPIFDEKNQTCVEKCDVCIYNGTVYEDHEVIYNVTDNLGMCYYSICINATAIHSNETCFTTPTPPPTPPSTLSPSTTTQSVTSLTTTEKPTTTTTVQTTTPQPTPTATTTAAPTPEPTATPTTTTTAAPTPKPTPPTTTTTTTTAAPTPEPTPSPTTSTTAAPTPEPTPPPTTSTTAAPTPEPTPPPTTTTTTTAAPTPESTPTPTTTTTTEPPTPEPTTAQTTKSTTVKTPAPTTPCIPTCEWSEWYDEDDSSSKSDWETYENITQSGKTVCEKPLDIECKDTRYPDRPLEEVLVDTKQVVTCDVNIGFICKKEDQPKRPGKCYNYKLRVYCCIICTTPTPPPTPTTTTTAAPTPTTTTTIEPPISGPTTAQTTTESVITGPTKTSPSTGEQITKSTTVNTPKPSTPHSTTEKPTTTTTVTTQSPTTSPTQSPTTLTTECICTFNGKHYKPGETILDQKDMGSGICLTMICSNICEIKNTTGPCFVPTPPPPTCPEWDKVQNETFLICNCTMARCIENNTIEIVLYECPPLENITCANGMNPVLVYDENYCCKYYVCDCMCEGWGDPHYITFDGLMYSYQGNCTYVLMEEIRPNHNLRIYIDNVYCDPTEVVSCPRSIIVSYNNQVITLKNHNLIGAVQLEALAGDVGLDLPFARHGIKILNSGLNMVLEIPGLQVVVTFGVNGFSVELPFKKFGNNTQGHCGTCNNNQHDDCMLPGGQLVNSCAVMADYWPAKDLSQPDCFVPPLFPPTDSPVHPSPKPCKPDSICDLLKSSLFEECHPFVSPDKFYEGCVFDGCHVSNPTVECTSLQTYAASCIQFGVCLHWRNHVKICASECPADKVYNPCGPAEQPTCDDNPADTHLNFTTEGCFCPDGMKLFNKKSRVCVDKCGCLDPEGVPREFNERFQYKCQDCICEKSTKTVTCKPKVCPESPVATCTDPGFILVNQTNPSDSCCFSLACECVSSTCPAKDMNCPIGFKPMVSVPEGKCCPETKCEPKRVCVHKMMEYQPDASVPVVECQDCTCTREENVDGLLKIVCHFPECNKSCDLGYEYIETDSDECCGKCLQTHCILKMNGTNKLLKPGDVWSMSGNTCESYSCFRNGATYVTTRSKIQCPPFQQSNCQPDSIQTAANGCCKICQEKDKACKIGSKQTRINYKGCQSVEEVDMPYCEGACNTFTKYSEVAAIMQQSCACCKELRSSNRTVTLQCLNGDQVPYTYMHVEECSCSHTDCNGAGRGLLRKGRSLRLV
ncbi:mucin-2-like [Hypomesus transpacificus]|uniref:mucin-2-like n=1 Tax=Hypomesus transpacificus TaxID=137520 RepID=UPI001F07FA50|nr:mucin-2-like [Hypomesus transpacificus]